jgi:hypothetical protein
METVIVKSDGLIALEVGERCRQHGIFNVQKRGIVKAFLDETALHLRGLLGKAVLKIKGKGGK